jgi:hypothetical protein
MFSAGTPAEIFIVGQFTAPWAAARRTTLWLYCRVESHMETEDERIERRRKQALIFIKNRRKIMKTVPPEERKA